MYTRIRVGLTEKEDLIFFASDTKSAGLEFFFFHHMDTIWGHFGLKNDSPGVKIDKNPSK